MIKIFLLYIFASASFILLLYLINFGLLLGNHISANIIGNSRPTLHIIGDNSDWLENISSSRHQRMPTNDWFLLTDW